MTQEQDLMFRNFREIFSSICDSVLEEALYFNHAYNLMNKPAQRKALDWLMYEYSDVFHAWLQLS